MSIGSPVAVSRRSAIRASLHVPAWLVGLTVLVLLIGVYSGAMLYRLDEGNPFKASYAYYLAWAVAGLCVLFPNETYRQVRKPLGLILVLLAYAVLIDLQIIFMETGVFDLFKKRLQFVLLAIAAILVLASYPGFRRVIFLLRAVVLFSSAMIAFEFFRPSLGMSTVPGRGAGLYMNPTISSMMIATSLPLMMLGASFRLKAFFATVTLVGVLLTFSRGGLIVWATALFLAIYLPVERRPILSARNLALSLSGIVGILFLIAFYQDLIVLFVDTFRDYLTPNTATRLLTLSDDSGQERFELLSLGWRAFEEAPIIGHGLGYTHIWAYPESVHNQFLIILAEQGLIGGLWLAVLIGALWRLPKPFGWWMVIMFVVSAFLMHNYFDSGLYALVIALYWYAGSFYRPDQPGPVPRYQ